MSNNFRKPAMLKTKLYTVFSLVVLAGCPLTIHIDDDGNISFGEPTGSSDAGPDTENSDGGPGENDTDAGFLDAGTETEPEILLAPSECDFGEVALGTAEFCDVAIMNVGSGVLQLTEGVFSVEEPAQYNTFSWVQNLDYPIDVLPEPTGSPAIRLWANPASTGLHSGTYTIFSNDPDTPEAVVTLRVVGLAASSTGCGDGVIDAGEGCDDGNLTNGDGCNDACLIESGNPCNTSVPLAWDDGCESGFCDGADATCKEYPYYCGDELVNEELGELCDDGNDIEGDGCEPDCTLTVETMFYPEPGQCSGEGTLEYPVPNIIGGCSASSTDRCAPGFKCCHTLASVPYLGANGPELNLVTEPDLACCAPGEPCDVNDVFSASVVNHPNAPDTDVLEASLDNMACVKDYSEPPSCFFDAPEGWGQPVNLDVHSGQALSNIFYHAIDFETVEYTQSKWDVWPYSSGIPYSYIYPADLPMDPCDAEPLPSDYRRVNFTVTVPPESQVSLTVNTGGLFDASLHAFEGCGGDCGGVCRGSTFPKVYQGTIGDIEAGGLGQPYANWEGVLDIPNPGAFPLQLTLAFDVEMESSYWDPQSPADPDSVFIFDSWANLSVEHSISPL